jgi:hypothetical protein
MVCPSSDVVVLSGCSKPPHIFETEIVAHNAFQVLMACVEQALSCSNSLLEISLNFRTSYHRGSSLANFLKLPDPLKQSGGGTGLHPDTNGAVCIVRNDINV